MLLTITSRTNAENDAARTARVGRRFMNLRLWRRSTVFYIRNNSHTTPIIWSQVVYTGIKLPYTTSTWPTESTLAHYYYRPLIQSRTCLDNFVSHIGPIENRTFSSGIHNANHWPTEVVKCVTQPRGQTGGFSLGVRPIWGSSPT